MFYRRIVAKLLIMWSPDLKHSVRRCPARDVMWPRVYHINPSPRRPVSYFVQRFAIRLWFSVKRAPTESPTCTLSSLSTNLNCSKYNL